MKATSKRSPRVQVAALSWLGLLIFGIASGWAQETSQSSNTSLKSDILKRMSGQSVLPTEFGQAVYEGAVDRNSYRVGPGDKLILQIWSPTYEETPAVVSGDGRVAVPFAGPVEVTGKTLAEAEELISAEFQSALRRGRVSVTLFEPRKTRIHVTGAVTFPGTYPMPATSRVADAVDFAGGLKSVLEFRAGDSVMVPMASMRRIEMRNGQTGAVSIVDLQRFFQGGDITGNPYILDGAVIFVPPAQSGVQVGIFGEVRNPGLYEHAQGDNVETLLALGGGLTELADSSMLSIERGNGEVESLNFSASSLAMPVHVGDRVYVGGKPRSNITGSVTISGQVSHPGGYTIVPGKTTVAELLNKCGGLLEDAASQSARLIRKSDDRVVNERRRVAANPLKTMVKDDPIMLADLEMSAEFSRWDYGTVVLDLSASEGESGFSGNVVLQDGDHLEVPSQPLGVRVLGYVNNAGEVPWQEGATLNHYIAQAGGKNSAGWKGRTVVLKARNGSQLRYTRKLSIDPGDVLFVPQRPRTTGWERIKDVIQVAAQAATIVLVLDTATKK